MNVDSCVAVGIEIGGGKTTVALIDRHGRVRRRCQAKTLRGRPAMATLEPYVRAIENMLECAQADDLSVCGLGVSVPGTVDYATRLPVLVPILPVLNRFPLCDFLETRCHLPAHIYADVDAAVLGEHRFGAGQNVQRLLYLTVNAVVGAALVIDGQLVHSTQQTVGHICHLSVSSSGARCSCGKRGCINTLVSLEAIQKMLQRALRRGDESSLMQRLQNREYFSLQLLAEEALVGDYLALQVYSEVGRWLGAALARYMHLFEPQMLILGGEVLYAGHDLLLSYVRTALVSAHSTCMCNIVDVLPASLGSDVALIGAVVPLFSPVCAIE